MVAWLHDQLDDGGRRPWRTGNEVKSSQMAHAADFVDANLRHWADAQLLLDHNRWANADQLYGFSAECGLKAVMMSLGMQVDAHGVPEPKHQKHVHEIWPIFESFAAGRSGERYLERLPDGKPFADWSHHDRYAHQQHFNRTGAERHREAARAIRGMVQSMAEDQGS